MDQERIDFSALDVARDRAGYERMIGRVLDSAAPELARRRAAARDPIVLIGKWVRPALAAAAAIAAVAIGSFWIGDVPAEPVAAAPEPLESWVLSEEPPSALELIAVIEGGE